jgi:MFS family permease
MQESPSIGHKSFSKDTLRFLPWLMVLLGALFYCYEYFLRIEPSVIHAALMSTFNLDAAGFGVLAGCYYFAYTPMQALVGVLFDRFGARRLLALASLICAIATYVFAHAATLEVAQVARFFIGFGSAFAFVGTLKIATIWLPPQYFGFISGTVTALGTIGGLVGYNIMAAWIDLGGWQAVTDELAAAGIVLAVILFWLLRDRRPKPHPDIIEIPKVTFRDVLTGLIYFLTKKQFWINGLIGCLLYLTLSAFAEVWGIPFVHQAYSVSLDLAARAVSITFFGWIIGGPLMGIISDKIRRRRPVLMIGSILAAISISFAIYGSHWSISMLDFFFFLFGFFASVQVLVFAVGRETSDPKVAGTAIAFTNMIVMLGGMVFQPLIGKLLDMHASGLIVNHVHIYTLVDYRFALTSLPISMLLSFFLAWVLKETYARAV